MKKKSKKIMIGLFVLALAMGLMRPTTAKAEVKEWMSSTTAVGLNGTYSGVTEYGVYHEYFRFYVPARMNITFQCTVTGNTPFFTYTIYDGNGKNLTEIWSSSWTYNPNNNTSNMKYTKTLNSGNYYFVVYDYIDRDETTYTYSGKLTANLISTPSIKSAVKKSKKSAVVKWSKTSSVSGYQIYRKTGKKGSYKLVKSVSYKNKKWKDTSLRKGKAYYYKVRAYKTINGKTYYSAFSRVKKAK